MTNPEGKSCESCQTGDMYKDFNYCPFMSYCLDNKSFKHWKQNYCIDTELRNWNKPKISEPKHEKKDSFENSDIVLMRNDICTVYCPIGKREKDKDCGIKCKVAWFEELIRAEAISKYKAGLKEEIKKLIPETTNGTVILYYQDVINIINSEEK